MQENNNKESAEQPEQVERRSYRGWGFVWDLSLVNVSSGRARSMPSNDQALPHGWAAIETAPKDGTKLLLWCGDEMEIGYWSTSIWVTRPADSPLGKQDGAWIIYENSSDTIELNPTHWQPLPLPPNDPSSPTAGGGNGGAQRKEPNEK